MKLIKSDTIGKLFPYSSSVNVNGSLPFFGNFCRVLFVVSVMTWVQSSLLLVFFFFYNLNTLTIVQIVFFCNQIM